MRTEREFCEAIMTVHWDIAQCFCPLCVYGRSQNYEVRVDYFPGHAENIDEDMRNLSISLLSLHFLFQRREIL